MDSNSQYTYDEIDMMNARYIVFYISRKNKVIKPRKETAEI